MAYLPNDSHLTAASLEFLHSPAGLPLREKAVALFSDHKEPAISDIEKLRKEFPADAVHAALTLASLQEKAHEKFPNLGDNFVYATPEALEQASSYVVACHKAQRLADAAAAQKKVIRRVFDFCCGIGGDTLALAEHFPVTAIDLSAVRTTCLRFNAQSRNIELFTDDVQKHLGDLTTNDLLHIDPARRSEGKRMHSYADLIPPPDLLEDAFKRVAGGALKLSPGVDFDDLPVAGPTHLELIAHRRSVVQAVLWHGFPAENLGAARRSATIVLDDAPAFSYSNIPRAAEFRDLSLLQEFLGGNPNHHAAVLFEIDGAFTRSQLAAPLAEELALAPITHDAGYLLGTQMLQHPALAAFEVSRILAYSEAKLLAALRDPTLPEAPVGVVEVKTRGKLAGVETDEIQRKISEKVGKKAKRTVFLFRNPLKNDQILAAITQRTNKIG